MDLDGMLKDIGQFGKFQAFYFFLLFFPVMLSGFRGTEYVFTTMNIPHRCRIPECEESSGTTQFNPSWLHHAVPFVKDNTPEACLRYRPKPNVTEDTNNTTSCPKQLFSSTKETCNDWVFAESVRIIAHDFNIMCPSEYWKLTLLGSLSVIASFVGMPLSGFTSDRIGRKTVLVFSTVLVSITGIIRSFSPSYVMLAALEVFDGLLTTSIYSPAFLLGLETLAPSKRLLGSMLINMYFTAGEVVLACVMWQVQDWRTMQRVFYVPMLAVVLLHWLLPESIRWLYTQGRYDDMSKIFRKIAKINKTEDKLPNIAKTLEDKHQESTVKQVEPIRTLRLGTVLRSRIIMWRLGVCGLCWVACIYTYYGISQYSIYAGGNRYASFLLVSLIEVPAYIASLWLPDWRVLGRKGSTAWSFFLGGAACLALTFITPEQKYLSLALFLVAKFCSTLTVCVIYVYTAEIFPTELRQSLLAICSMVGRIGSVLSQQTPLLVMYINPAIVFGLASMVGGTLALSCPETLHTKLPDTIQEAENIGSSRNRVGNSEQLNRSTKHEEMSEETNRSD